MIHCDLHVHTSRDHGRHSAEEMVQQAARQGLQTLGLVGHAAMQFPCSYAMTAENEETFLRETALLRQQYARQLSLFCGIELDYYSLPTDVPYDYRLGSVHYVKWDDHIISVDSDPQELISAVQTHWADDWLSLCRLYYETVADLGPTIRPDIIAHIDLITKFNESGCLFSADDRRYRHLALDAVDALLPADPIFEINTGAISRGYRTAPYPAPFILQHIRRRGGRILLSSDAHDKTHLLYGFDSAAELAESCGFRSAWTLSTDGWQEIPL